MRVFRLLDNKQRHHQQTTFSNNNNIKMNFTHQQTFKQLEMRKLNKMRAKAKIQDRKTPISLISLHRSFMLQTLGIFSFLMFCYHQYLRSSSPILQKNKNLHDSSKLKIIPVTFNLNETKYESNVSCVGEALNKSMWVAGMNYGRVIHEKYFKSCHKKLVYMDIGIQDGKKSQTYYMDKCLANEWYGLCLIKNSNPNSARLFESIYAERSCQIIPLTTTSNASNKSNIESILTKEKIGRTTTLDYINIEGLNEHKQVLMNMINDMLTTKPTHIHVMTISMNAKFFKDIAKIMEAYHFVSQKLELNNSKVFLFVHQQKLNTIFRQNSVTQRMSMMPI